MLGKSEYGWTTFGICDEHQYRLGYLTDVSVEWLGQAIHGLKTLEPFAVHGFCEPCRMICTVCYWDCYIILTMNVYNHISSVERVKNEVERIEKEALAASM